MHRSVTPMAMRNVNVGWVCKGLVSRWTCRWGPFWRPPNLMDRLDTLIVFLLVECIKWLPPTDGCTAIGPYLWRLSIESWEEVGTSELAWVWSNWSEKSRCGGHFLDDVDPGNNVVICHGELVWLSSANLLTTIFVSATWVAWVGWSLYSEALFEKIPFIRRCGYSTKKNTQPSLVLGQK